MSDVPEDGTGFVDYDSILRDAGVPEALKAGLQDIRRQMDALLAEHTAQSLDAKQRTAALLGWVSVGESLVSAMNNLLGLIPAGPDTSMTHKRFWGTAVERTSEQLNNLRDMLVSRLNA